MATTTAAQFDVLRSLNKFCDIGATVSQAGDINDAIDAPPFINSADACATLFASAPEKFGEFTTASTAPPPVRP